MNSHDKNKEWLQLKIKLKMTKFSYKLRWSRMTINKVYHAKNITPSCHEKLFKVPCKTVMAKLLFKSIDG